MPAKRTRLTGRAIQFLLRRGTKKRGQRFGYIYTVQPNHRSFHQRSIQIPVKVDKRATIRNLLKRHASLIFQQCLQSFSIPYGKFFIFVNKQSIDALGKLIATSSKSAIVSERKKYCEHDFMSFMKNVWPSLETLLSTTSKPTGKA